MSDYKAGILFILVFILFITLNSCTSVNKSEIRELIEDKLVDDFTALDLYFDYDDSISFLEARDAFERIETELNKLY